MTKASLEGSCFEPGAIEKRVHDALAGFSALEILVVGDPILDVYLSGLTGRVSREAPVLVVEKESVEYRLGGAANVALNLAGLGVDVHFVGSVGDDEAAAVIEAMLKNASVRTTLYKNPQGVTSKKTRVLAGASGTSRQQILRIDDAVQGVAALSKDVLKEHAQGKSAVALSDYGLNTLDFSQLGELCSVFDLPVCVDSRNALARVRGATVVTPNWPEAEAAVGWRIHDVNGAKRAAKQLAEDLCAEHILLTMGREGMLLYSENKSQHLGIVGDEEVTDVTGAGDTVLSMICASVASGFSLRQAMTLANAAAGLAVSKSGCVSVSVAELAQFCEREGVEMIA